MTETEQELAKYLQKRLEDVSINLDDAYEGLKEAYYPEISLRGVKSKFMEIQTWIDENMPYLPNIKDDDHE